MQLLYNKVAIITGGASGIGKATCQLFAEQGAKVIIADVNEEAGHVIEQQIVDDGREATFVKTDVSSSEQVENLFSEVQKRYGKLDILCNNAGIGMEKLFHNVDEEDWERIHNVNLKSVYLCSRLAIPIMLENGGGSIVNVSSVNAESPRKFYSIYASSKGGVSALTKGMAIDYAEENIRVNAVLPGCIYTEQTKKSIENSPNPQQTKDLIYNMQPLKRPGKPEEVAKLIIFLASDQASFITGSCIPIDGGMLARSVISQD